MGQEGWERGIGRKRLGMEKEGVWLLGERIGLCSSAFVDVLWEDNKDMGEFASLCGDDFGNPLGGIVTTHILDRLDLLKTLLRGQKPHPKSRNTKTPHSHKLLRKVRASFCLLPCDPS